MKAFQAGRLVKQGGYKSFELSKINRDWLIDDMEVVNLLSDADRELGRLDMFSQSVPNLQLFIKMHVTKEATRSSRIEGAQTRMEEVFLAERDIPEEKRDDWEEVQNYISALERAVDELKTIPFSTRLIKSAHAVLMRGVRGERRQPGVFRTSQNWIGGASLRDAVFVPPPHHSIPQAMSDLEEFVHNEDILLPPLLKIALAHYQFETIHPFLDGNGRVGRLMIPVYLVERGILKLPVLYLSDYLERNRSIYYENLTQVREKNALAQWFKFFLVGIIETARSGVATFNAILRLQEDIDERLKRLGPRAENGRAVLRELYQRPVIDARLVREITGLSASPTYRLIEELESIGVLTETTGGKRDRKYLFKEYVALFTAGA
jgi:cell filamentation protein, protein adenylyltransferase